MRTVGRIALTSFFVAIIIAIFIAVQPHNTMERSGNIVENTKNDIMNSIIDSSGIKQSVEGTLRSYSQEIAQAIGTNPTQVNNMIDTLRIPDWQASSLPNNAVAAQSYTIIRDNFDAKITTYDTPEYVTIHTHGQDVTMKVPPSAQSYLPYLEYLRYL